VRVRDDGRVPHQEKTTMKKKAFSYAAMLSMLLALAGCASDPQPVSTTTTTTEQSSSVQPVTTTTANTTVQQ